MFISSAVLLQRLTAAREAAASGPLMYDAHSDESENSIMEGFTSLQRRQWLSGSHGGGFKTLRSGLDTGALFRCHFVSFGSHPLSPPRPLRMQ